MEDAEVALIMLAPSLVWKAQKPGLDPPPDYVWEKARHNTSLGYHQEYEVELSPGNTSQALVRVSYWTRGRKEREPGQPILFYQSVNAAKAACEIHAATSRFPESEPALLRQPVWGHDDTTPPAPVP